METEPTKNISPVQRIDGVKLRLGSMAIDDLLTVKTYALARLEQAQADLDKIQAEINNRDVNTHEVGSANS